MSKDILKSDNLKKVFDVTKSIIQKKEKDPFATIDEISRESKLPLPSVDVYAKILCEKGIFYKEPLRESIVPGHRVAEWKYGIRKMLELGIEMKLHSEKEFKRDSPYIV